MGKVTDKLKQTSLQNRFLFNVLAPPFFVLLAISLAGFWLLDKNVRTSAVSELVRASATTAAKVERELAIREAVLKTTGTEIFNIKTEYQSRRDELQGQYSKCKNHVRTSFNFLSAPNNSCDPFLEQFARDTSNLPAAVEKGYQEKSQQLNNDEQSDIAERLSAYAGFFPETLALYLTDKQASIISSSRSNDFNLDNKTILPFLQRAAQEAVEGVRLRESSREAVFAYPIDNGAVAAVYAFDHAAFVRPSWQQTPIDGSRAYALIVNQDDSLTYPETDNPSLYQKIVKEGIDHEISYQDEGIDYLGVGASAGKSGWKVAVGSPSAFVLEPVKNAQLAAVIVIGLLLVAFLWVGAIFVKNTISSILLLAGGALIFGSNKLDYRIELARKNDKEFNQLAETMNNMAARIQAAENEIDQKNKEFISVATHELKAPMTAIIGNLSMTLEDGVGYMDDNARKLTASAYTGTIRLRNLVSELLDIARLESGRAKFNIESLDIFSETEEMIALQKTPAEQKQIVFTHRPALKLPNVKADKNKLQIVMTNFISNAIKYNRSPGRIILYHSLENGMVKTAIQDTGLGIPPEQKDKMFQKFFRVDADNRRGIEGTGLGMYITKQFIEAMGGRVWFESEPERGTVFHFTLPADHTPDPIASVKTDSQAQADSRANMVTEESYESQPYRTADGIKPRNTP